MENQRLFFSRSISTLHLNDPNLMSTKSLLFLNTADSTIGDVFVWLNSIGINIKKRLEPSLIILNLK